MYKTDQKDFAMICSVQLKKALLGSKYLVDLETLKNTLKNSPPLPYLMW